MRGARAGKSASGLKEVTDSFQDGLKEGLVNAEELKSASSEPPIVTAEVEESKDKGSS